LKWPPGRQLGIPELFAESDTVPAEGSGENAKVLE
jgi:hypothetical protein